MERSRFWLNKKPFHRFTNEDGSLIGWAFEKYHWSDDTVTVRVSVRAYVSHRIRISRASYVTKVMP